MQVRPPTYPTYAADGRRLRGHSQESIERLEGLKLVLVQRNRRRVIVSAHYFGQTRSPLQSRLRAGTRYVYREHVGDIGHAWTHKPLPWRAINAQLEHLAEPEVVDRHVMALFQAVPLSCVSRETEAPKSAKVVSIDTSRKFKRGISLTPSVLAA